MGKHRTIINYKIDPDTGEKIYNNQKITLKTATGLFEELLERVISDDKVLSIQLLLQEKQYRDRGIKYFNLWHYCQKYPRCQELNEEIKAVIKERIIVGALRGDYKENFAKFLLTGLYGMESEKKDININENIKFNFGNPELMQNVKKNEIEKHIEDITFEDNEDDINE